MDIHYYADSRGCQPVYEWIQHIEKHDKATWRKFYQLQIMLKENGKLIHGGQIKRKDIKKLKGTDIWQLRVNDNRVLFFYFSSNAIIFTNQFEKKQNNTPQNEIDRAENRKEEWLKNH
ncbi:TPA: type II toxin-antitoxin system RelE/ParE family toxin [Bacillus cereus]|nr:type II toxin-antitoxin system RelE/ParE family toxin [Bacillus cereus]HDR8266797.1 type II toxin-antitoxin system RelE/ParE family toxin [Bacillus cereus]HDR8271972.1 type II toxin-antitoxin system RelE/ParE family toxin [Bacillus cereus]HDR8277341.1 type II toxin-antitoxin system RelE/ParE family toxin [Bacillus cereus]HDR8282806.1 type II toxin-antitoxin system RelE/ParE family toxin [Bacillus cereus]